MKRIESTAKIKLQKKRAKKGEVSVRDKKNGKEARVTLQLNIPGVPNPRLNKYGATEEIAKKKLAEAILLKHIEVQKNKQFANIQVFSPECQEELEKFDEYMERIAQYESSKLVSNSEKKKEIKYPISMFIEKMIMEKKRQSEIIYTNKRRRKKITNTTVTFYWRIAKKQVIPIFGELDAATVNQEQLQEYFDMLDYSPKYLKDIRLVLKLSLEIAIKEKIRVDNPAERIDISCSKKSLGIEIEHLEQDRQEVWLDIFEKDKRQWVYLFEAILLTGARPEEGCRT